MFDRFSGSARKTMAISRKEAQRLGHDHIDVGHILLALFQDGAAAWILSKLGANLTTLRDEVEARMPEGQARFVMGQVPFTPGAKRALENTFLACRELGHSAVNTPQLLLGMLHPETESPIAQSLAALNITSDAVRREIMLLDESPDLFREATMFRSMLTPPRQPLFSEPAWRSFRALCVFCLFVGGFFFLIGKGLAVIEISGRTLTFRSIGGLIMASALLWAVLAFRSWRRGSFS